MKARTFPKRPTVSLRRTRWAGTLAAAALVTCFCGCGEKETWLSEIKEPAYPVQGKVLLPGGSPLGSGRVEFLPIEEPGLLAFAEIKSDGSFELQTRAPGDGAIPGDYKVKIMIPEKQEYGRLARYRDEDSSKLTARVKPKANVLAPFQLK